MCIRDRWCTYIKIRIGAQRRHRWSTSDTRQVQSEQALFISCVGIILPSLSPFFLSHQYGSFLEELLNLQKISVSHDQVEGGGGYNYWLPFSKSISFGVTLALMSCYALFPVHAADAAVREVKEETGIDAGMHLVKCVLTTLCSHCSSYSHVYVCI